MVVKVTEDKFDSLRSIWTGIIVCTSIQIGTRLSSGLEAHMLKIGKDLDWFDKVALWVIFLFSTGENHE